MPPKKRAKKKAANDPARKRKLAILIAEFDSKCEMHITRCKEMVEHVCKDIDMFYENAMASIPEKYLNKTLEEIEQMEKETPPRVNNVSYISVLAEKMRSIDLKRAASSTRLINRTKSILNQSHLLNRTHVLNSTIQKSNLNLKSKRKQFSNAPQTTTPMYRQRVLRTITPVVRASTARNLPVKRKIGHSATGASQQQKRQALETPVVYPKKSKLYVTPKLDPKLQLNNSILQKAKYGETVNGSPNQNMPIAAPDKPHALFSLGDGQYRDISDKWHFKAMKKAISVDDEARAFIRKVQKSLSILLPP